MAVPVCPYISQLQRKCNGLNRYITRAVLNAPSAFEPSNETYGKVLKVSFDAQNTRTNICKNEILDKTDSSVFECLLMYSFQNEGPPKVYDFNSRALIRQG
jgi:hypothetical protein